LKTAGKTLLLVIAVLTFCQYTPEALAGPKKNVLILNSYHQGFKWTDDITRGIISALEPASGTTRIYIDYLDTKWVKDEKYFQQLRQILKHKYSGTHFDLIVASDNDAFDFLRDYRDEVFGRIPVVFCGVNYFQAADLAGKHLFTGISETADIKESLDLALRLHPLTKSIFIINDSGISGRKVREEIVRLIPLFRGRVQFNFEYSTDLGQIVKDVETLAPGTIIFYTFFYGDVGEKFYEYNETISTISQHARVPIYGAWDFNLGYGMVGGKLTRGYDQGRDAGQMGLRILRGENVGNIPVVYRSRTRNMFDFRQLKRFGIRTSALPGNSIVINQPDPFHRVRTDVVWGALFGLAGLSTLVIFLLGINHKRRQSEESLQKASSEMEMIIEERTRNLSELNEKLCEDIRARQRTEEELRKSQTILSKIFEANPDLLWVIDGELRILHSNWRGVYEKAPDDITNKSLYCYKEYYGLDQPCVPCHALEIFRTGKPVFREKVHPTGAILEIRSYPVFDEAGGVAMVVEHIRDITEKKRMEEDILKSQNLESLGVLAGGIAHDFNNLLTGILGNISLAKMYVGPATKAHARLEEAEKASERTRDLTRQLLTFSKGGAPVKKVASMARIIMDSASLVLRGSNVRCEFFPPEDLWAVEVDEGQMSQVINNLIINAGQAMPDGGIITVHAENVTLGSDHFLPLREGRYICISIRDHGMGIPEKNLPKIFNPYFTTREKGSGLGLASVYSIIKKHDGYVGVESKPGLETTFYLYIPASDKCLEMETVPEAQRKPFPEDKGRILVMDDEEVVRQVAAEMLDHLGYQVDVCGNGGEVLSLYREARESGKPYAAVIMDLTIPGGMGGKETMKKLLEIDPDVKGVVSSGYSFDPIVAHHRKYGFSGVVTKPYKVDEMCETLQALV